MPALPQDNKVLSSTATGLEWVEIAQPDLTNYYNKTEIDHKILGGVADDDISSKNMTGIVKHKYNDADDHFLWVSQNLYPSEIVGLQEFMNNAITIESVENQFPVLQTFTADSFLELATDQKVFYITLTQYSPLTIEYQYGTGSVITHTYTTFNPFGYEEAIFVNISQYDYIAFRITATFEYRLRLEKYHLDPDYISASSTSTSYSDPTQITQDYAILYLHHDGGYHAIMYFRLDPPRYQNKFQSAVIPADTTKIDYMNFINSGGTHYLRIGRNQVYSDINLDVNLGWLAGANHNHDTVYAPLNHNHDGVYLKTVEDVFAFMDRSKFELNDDNRINLTGDLSYFTESSSTDSIGTATTTLSYNGNIDITGELDCVNVTVDSLTFRDNSYITSATGLGSGGGGGGVVNYTDIQVPTITETVPGDLITDDVTPTISPNHYYIDQASPATEYTVLQTNATNLKVWYKFDDGFDDSSGNGHNALPYNGLTPVTSTTQYKINKSAYFTNDNLIIDGFTLHNKSFSISVWSYATEGGVILSQQKATATNQNLHIRVAVSGNNVRYDFHFWANDLSSAQIYPDLNTWVHLVFQIHSNGNKEIWRNGVRIANDLNTSFLNTDDADLVLGNWNYTNNYYGSYLDDFRIYDTVLTTDEISLLYNQKVLVNIEPQDIPTTTDYKTLTFTYDATRYPEIDADATNLKVWYKFDGDTNDSSGNNDLVNISGFTSYQFDNDSIVGQSSFTPADTANMIQTNNTNFSSMTECSISLWIKFSGDRSTEYDVVYHVDYNRNAVFHRMYDTPGSSSSGNSNARIMLLCNYDWDVGSGFITEDVWTHYCITAKKNGTYTDMKVYKNGVLFNSLLGTATFENTNSKIRFGFDSTSYVFQGYLDDFRIYDKALTADEINTLYNVNQTPYTLTFDNPAECDILIVGGGGGGSRWRAGGGGGDVLYFQGVDLSGTYNVKVGEGGAVPRDTSQVHKWGGYNGEISSITGGDSGKTLNINASGGAGAGGWSLDPLNPVTVLYTNPITGATETSSGGGAGTANTNHIPSTGNGVSGNGAQGDYDGWENSADDGAGGGGGGGGTNGNGGLPVGETGGTGGDGENIDITGTSIMYGRGGDGWGENNGTPIITPENIGQGGAGARNPGGIHRPGGSGIVIIRYKTTYTTGSPHVTTQITPRGVLKYNTNDEWSLSTISQTDIADLEQNSIIKFLLRQSLELHKRVYELETSTPVLWDTIGIYEYKYEYGNDWAIIKDNNETFTISNRRVTNNLFIRLVNYYPKTDNNYLLKSGLPQLIDDTTLPLQIYNFKYGDTLPLNPTIKINSSEICQLTLNEASYVTAIRIQISYTGYDNTFAYANLPASITVPLNDVIIIKILDIDTYIPGEREYYYRTTVSNTGSSFPIVQTAGFVSENIFPEVIALSATPTINRLGLDVYTGGVQPATATENIAMSIDINVV